MIKYDDCEIDRIIDGDTQDVDIYIKDDFLQVAMCIRKRIRLARINCPEMNTEEGKKAKNYVESIITKEIDLIVHGQDRYGRLVAEIILSTGQNLSDLLLETNNAKLYTLSLMLEN